MLVAVNNICFPRGNRFVEMTLGAINNVQVILGADSIFLVTIIIIVLVIIISTIVIVSSS